MNKGIYIHYPFCDSKCLYCDFFSVPDMRKREAYEEKLVEAILSYRDSNFKADTVFFGGGTPSLMTDKGGEKIFAALKAVFAIDDTAEITLEANPSGIEERLEFFKSLGVNRLSLGAQSMQEKELSALGRRHTPQDIENTVKKARDVGFDNISLDLMVRIPHQTVNTLKSTLDRVLGLSPDHLSLYTLSIEEKTVFGARYKKGDSLNLASADDEETMWDTACEILSRNGFEHYEISNFSKDGKVSRHNLKYWHAEEYIGIGSSAHSYLDGRRFYSARSIDAFIENPLKREGEEILTQKDKALERVMLSLRLSEGLSLKELSSLGITPTPQFYLLCERLSQASLSELKKENLSLTERGFRVSNTIIENVLETLNLI